MNKKKSPERNRIFWKVTCIVLGLILTCMLGGTAYLEHLLNQVNYIEPDAPTPTLSVEEVEEILQEEDEEETVPVEYTGPVEKEEDIVLVNPNAVIGGKDIVNVLLVGKDKDVGGGSRTDSMILVTLNKGKKSITLTSFLRDMYVRIPEYKKDRLNTAYALGGVQLLNETLQTNFGIEIDGNVEIDFSHFRKLINLLGGVEIELNEQEAAWINKKTKSNDVTAGVQLLNGKQALWYARFRGDALGDFNRTNRQRVVLSTLIDAYKGKSFPELVSLLDEILPMVTTDFEKKEILTHAITFFPMLSSVDIVTQRIPADDCYYLTMVDGKSVVVPRIQQNVAFLLETLGGSAEEDPGVG